MELYSLSASEIAKKIKLKEVSIKEVLDNVFKRIDEVESKIDAYVTITKEYAYKRAEELQVKLDNGQDIGRLGGVPVSVKDLICTKDIKTTCSSRMLENFVPCYNATVVEKLEKDGAIIIGKTNLDEFAMGSTTATSYIKKTKNPWDLERVPGGSSGGSAASIAADTSFASLGTDTGGSIRQPAAYNSVVGLKPTYSVVSRYGVVAYASSLDQVGPITKTVEDAALVLSVISGYDDKDTTSAKIDYPEYTKALVNDVKGIKIGVPRDFLGEGLNEEIKEAYELALEKYKELGAEIVDIKLEYAKYSLATYYIIATAEASSNLGRYDGIKYGHRAKDFDDLIDLYKKSRTEGFGEEVKRRIMLGTYVLSSGYYDAYYKKAGKVRTKIIQDFKNAFEKVDVIAIPTTPATSFKFGEKTSNPVEMYLEDIYTVPVNIAGLPAISIPMGFDSKKLPIGLQIIGKAFDEERIINVAYTFEQNTKFHNMKPEIK